MPRLIPDQRSQGPGRGHLDAKVELTKEQKVENYLERVARYVPVEIVVAFLAIRGSLPASGTANAIPSTAEFVIYGALVVLTPLYLNKYGGAVPQKSLQLVVATASFVVWSYGIGGPFFFNALERATGMTVEYSGLSSAILVIWSLLIGLIEPK
jgi:hypothetical protein